LTTEEEKALVGFGPFGPQGGLLLWFLLWEKQVPTEEARRKSDHRASEGVKQCELGDGVPGDAVDGDVDIPADEDNGRDQHKPQSYSFRVHLYMS
jgi:hypothetical protein